MMERDDEGQQHDKKLDIFFFKIGGNDRKRKLKFFLLMIGGDDRMLGKQNIKLRDDKMMKGGPKHLQHLFLGIDANDKGRHLQLRVANAGCTSAFEAIAEALRKRS